MKTQQAPNDTKILKAVADNLLALQQEIDELTLQFALGKAEAKETYAAIKKDLLNSMHTWRNALKGHLSLEAQVRLDELEAQLIKTMADSPELFEKQRHHILALIQEIEKDFKIWWEKTEKTHHLEYEFEKFKLKLEILRLHFTVKKFEIKEGFREAMADVKSSAHALREEVQENLEESWEQVRDKSSSIYKKISKALNKLRP